MSIICYITHKVYTLLSICLLPPLSVSTPARVVPLAPSWSSSEGRRGRGKGRRNKGRDKRASTPRKGTAIKPGPKSQGRVIHYILQNKLVVLATEWLQWLQLKAPRTTTLSDGAEIVMDLYSVRFGTRLVPHSQEQTNVGV